MVELIVTGITVEFPFGYWVHTAADAMCELANDRQTKVSGEWNGTPIFAEPGETADQVCNRWAEVRAAIQERMGVKQEKHGFMVLELNSRAKHEHG